MLTSPLRAYFVSGLMHALIRTGSQQGFARKRSGHRRGAGARCASTSTLGSASTDLPARAPAGPEAPRSPDVGHGAFKLPLHFLPDIAPVLEAPPPPSDAGIAPRQRAAGSWLFVVPNRGGTTGFVRFT